MKRKLFQALTVGVLAIALLGFTPRALPAVSVTAAPDANAAAISKSAGGGGGGGGGNVSGAGDRFGDLLSGWAVPVLTVLAGCLLVGSLASRNIGASVGIVVITLLGLIFLLSPQSIEALAKGIAKVVF